MDWIKRVVGVSLALLLSGCLGMPEGVKPVTDFELPRYLGTWYEVARLDHSFERGLEQVSAEYSLREGGGLRVVNRGYDPVEGVWQEAIGRAYFVGEPTDAYLKVSFFGPFFGSYVVFDLDDDYQYAFIAGPDTGYLWLLSRTPSVPDSVKARFISLAQAKGFDTESLIWVRQSPGHP